MFAFVCVCVNMYILPGYCIHYWATAGQLLGCWCSVKRSHTHMHMHIYKYRYTCMYTIKQRKDNGNYWGVGVGSNEDAHTHTHMHMHTQIQITHACTQLYRARTMVTTGVSVSGQRKTAQRFLPELCLRQARQTPRGMYVCVCVYVCFFVCSCVRAQLLSEARRTHTHTYTHMHRTYTIHTHTHI
jgi:hypothetical protein